MPIQILLHEAYASYNEITAVSIEKRRLKHRLKVICRLESSTAKSILRGLVNHFPTFTEDDLEVS